MKTQLFSLCALLICVLVVIPDCLAQRRGNRNRSRQRGDNGNSLKVAEKAPTFKLKSLDGESETDLSLFAGKKPVVLIFGSYT